MGRWANADGAMLGNAGRCVCECDVRWPGHVASRVSDWPGPTGATAGRIGRDLRDRTDRRRPGGHELDRLRQLRALSVDLAQACTVDDIVDTLAVRVAGDCGAETSVVYLMDPDQEDVLRLAAARGLPGGRLGSGGAVPGRGALIARAVRARQPQLIRACANRPARSTTAVACPLLLRADTAGRRSPTASRATSPWTAPATSSCWGPARLVALALDRTAATERAREAQQTSEYMTSVLRRIFGGEQKTLA